MAGMTEQEILAEGQRQIPLDELQTVYLQRGRVRDPVQWNWFANRLASTKEKARYAGMQYKTMTGEWLHIVDCCILLAPHHICNGLALLLGDGYWYFGCPEVPAHFRKGGE